ncbi:hypothetical protein T190_31640 [Sinorhizobium meliloti CCBAU 01290]|nr:hypothetical protein T190_31640 [Sinorhizobium meliloti CCBAU 01290]
MRSSPVADGHIILIVADAVVVAEVEFIDLDLVAIAIGQALKESVCQWVITFMASIIALVPSLGVRPDGPCTRSGFQRPTHGAKA